MSREGIFGIHPDILKNHILTRLDGPSLAATDCSSWELHALASDDELWKRICTSTWPSSGDPRVSRVISTFPGAYRSFFAYCRNPVHHHSLWSRSSGFNKRPSDLGTTSEMGLIVTFDVYYEDIHFLSYMMEEHDWFQADWEPFDDLVDPEEIKEEEEEEENDEDDTWIKELQQNLTLSCVVIDPEKKQAMTVSMRQRAVLAQREGLTGNVHLKFATVMAKDSERGRWWGGTKKKKELVELEMVVTNGRRHVVDVFLRMKDIEGRYICARDIVVILKRALQEWGEEISGKSIWSGTSITAYEGRQRFKDFLVEKRKWKASKNKFKLFFGAIMCL